MSLWLVGTGAMAQEYARVLRDLGHEFEAIGRGPDSAARFESATGHAVRRGGWARSLAESGAPSQAIVAVGVEHLAETACGLIEAGTPRILLEKPGGLSTAEVRSVQLAAARHGADVRIAYNRRFYAATARAREMIAEDEGATSCVFEFTEWPHAIAAIERPPAVKAAWFFANSTHVVDLAFHLCGLPRAWRAWRAGSLPWHPAAARFCGAGISEQGVFFSYHADWEAPGRWGVEVLTRRRRLVLRPLEQLQVIQQGSVSMSRVELDDRLDQAFKPGLHAQTRAFIAGEAGALCTVDEQLRHCAIYDEMVRGTSP